LAFLRVLCLVRQLVRRNCFYHRHKTRKNAKSSARGAESVR